MKELELVILGAGPAGLGAAIEAAKAGVKVGLLDENPEPGGQIYRHMVDSFQITQPKLLGHDYTRGQKLLAEFNTIRERVEYIGGALVWGLFPGSELTYIQDSNPHGVHYRKLIIAVGAYDRPVPFPGWTLPGVFTAGAAQQMIKTQGLMPGERFLLAGTGPLLLSLANLITDAGGEVVAIAEAGKIENWFQMIQGAWGNWRLIADGLRYLKGIYRARIPLLRSHVIVKARGNGQVQEAVVAPVDQTWQPLTDQRRTLKVDTVCVGYGFVPSVELTRLAECNHKYEPLLGGWVPVRNSYMETSIYGVYAAGDCTSIAGSLVAVEEGRIAGLAVAQSLGHLSQMEADQKMAPCRRRMAKLEPLRRQLDGISMPRTGLYGLSTEDTIICRCEEITLSEIKKAIAGGATDMNEIKRMTRTGMGNCQGRMCGPALQGIIARAQGLAISDINYYNIRPPIKPVLFTALNRKIGE